MGFGDSRNSAPLSRIQLAESPPNLKWEGQSARTERMPVNLVCQRQTQEPKQPLPTENASCSFLLFRSP